MKKRIIESIGEEVTVTITNTQKHLRNLRSAQKALGKLTKDSELTFEVTIGDHGGKKVVSYHRGFLEDAIALACTDLGEIRKVQAKCQVIALLPKDIEMPVPEKFWKKFFDEHA